MLHLSAIAFVRGDVVEIWPAYAESLAFRVEFFGDEIDRLCEINPLTGVPIRDVQHVAIYPASHYVTTKEKLERAIHVLEEELDERVKWFEARRQAGGGTAHCTAYTI